MTWEIVVGIISLATFIFAVSGYISKLSKTLTSLEVTLVALNKTLEDFRESNKEAHRRFYEWLEDHEKRIIHLEDTDRENNPPR